MSALLYELKDGIAKLTLNRPEKHNALNPELLLRLSDTFKSIADDPAVRVVLLTGAGSKAFCSGADLGAMVPLVSGARPPADEWDHRWLKEFREATNVAFLRDFPFYKPVVAAVNGFCVAGGFEIMLASDIRVAARESTFWLSEVRRGLIAPAGGLSKLPRQIGWANACEILLAANKITADRALSMGLINRVVAPEDVLPVALEFCAALAEAGPFALAQSKEVMVRSNGRPLEEAFRLEQEAIARVLASEDAREGPTAFMEKRKPNFVGR
jgi:enoyl-CoA hydratase